MLGRIRKLRKAGVLGINERNGSYVMPLNKRALYQLVDDKVKTKLLAGKAGINVPELYGLISTIRDAERIHEIVDKRHQFVIKPAHGSGGKGVMVVNGRRKNLFIMPDGHGLTADLISYHISNILGGIYSLGGQEDKAIVEYCVNFDPVFNSLSYQGVPDIRVIVYRGVPTMAMLRLPTKQSDGKANLHQGAVGVGLEMRSGTTTWGTCRDRRIFEHPDFGTPLANWQVPGWADLLLLAARCHELAPLGYLGVDLVLDARLGPLVLELNARPGLAIQIANNQGLRPRLDAIDQLAEIPARAEDRVDLGQALPAQPLAA